MTPAYNVITECVLPMTVRVWPQGAARTLTLPASAAWSRSTGTAASYGRWARTERGKGYSS